MKKYVIALTTLLSFIVSVFVFTADDAGKPVRDKAQKLYNQGNYKEAYDIYSKLALGEETVPIQVGEDLGMAVNCLQNLNRLNEFDELMENSVAKNSDNWMLLKKSADIYMYINHYGFMISGKFERGEHRGGGKYMNSQMRNVTANAGAGSSMRR
jgi:hypothetical protein